MNCDLAQGYLISRPTPLAHLPALLAQDTPDLASGMRDSNGIANAAR